ncbi:response regulator [Marinicellulosiphila megalodicopiae]|uniref:response regulator n=1 Tax=Marinicellulosiphila megalodicopiae TaxID=2724896 RepID=UPI003BAFD4DB
MNKCLVVDDLPFNTQVLKAQLTHLGLQVTTCFSGKSAIQACIDDQFDCIFMDITMPDMSGTQAAEQILHATTQLPPPIIFALSGHDAPAVIPDCFNLWLTKPINKDQLANIVLTQSFED